VIRILIMTIAVLTLSSCGGGGSGGAPAASNTFNASFTVSANIAQIPFTVSVDGSSSVGADTYSWTFGDGNSDTGITSSNTYTSPGSYNITLTISDGTNTTTASQTITALGYNVSGVITAPNTSVADSDTADPNMSSSNNSFNLAQLLPNPATVGGHLSSNTDTSDFYRVDLTANQSINLTISQYQSGGSNNPDLDLYLYDDNQTGINSALGTDGSESLTVTQAGTYFIEVRAVSGSSSYLLNIGGASINQSSTSLTSEFVVGEAVFRQKASTQFSATSALPSFGKLSMNDLSAQGNPSLSSTIEALSQQTMTGHWTEEQIEKIKTLKWLKQLNATNNYDYVEPNYIHKASFTPNDQYFNIQWHYNNIQLQDALDEPQGTGDSNVIVAVIDTGVLTNHPDLQGQLVAGYDFISSITSSLDQNGIDNDPNDPGDQSLPGGTSSFHGTHVAGTIAATTNNTIGVSGVAGGVRIMPLRVLGRNGTGTSYDIIQSLQFAAGQANDSGTVPAQTPDIINLSLGSTSFSQAEQDIYNTLAGLDILVIAAAGNRNSSTPDYPAAYNNVISVSATTLNNQRASYSNFGNTIDVAAPGGQLNTDLNGDGFPDGVLSTMGDDSTNTIQFNYGYSEGTSMAAPHVAGVAALMKSANSNLSVSDFNTLLTNGDLTDDLGSAGRDNQFGYGLINARKAVLAATNTANASANIVLSTNTLNFGSFSNSEAITLNDSSGGTLSINTITPSDSWLTVSADSVDANGFGSYNVNVDRSSLADGIYTGSVVFDATSTSRTLIVMMQVATTPIAADAGYIYILAIDPDSRETIGFTEGASVNGQYVYTIENLDAGNYQIVAGTDLNGDDFICDRGDSCGAFPTLDQTITLGVNQSTSNVDFSVSFESSISSSSNEKDERETFKIPSTETEGKYSTPSLLQ